MFHSDGEWLPNIMQKILFYFDFLNQCYSPPTFLEGFAHQVFFYVVIFLGGVFFLTNLMNCCYLASSTDILYSAFQCTSLISPQAMKQQNNVCSPNRRQEVLERCSLMNKRQHHIASIQTQYVQTKVNQVLAHSEDRIMIG